MPDRPFELRALTHGTRRFVELASAVCSASGPMAAYPRAVRRFAFRQVNMCVIQITYDAGALVDESGDPLDGLTDICPSANALVETIATALRFWRDYDVGDRKVWIG